MPTAAVTIKGLDEFRRELKRFDTSLGKEFRQIMLKVSRLIASRSQAATPRAHARSAISPKATQKAAQLRVSARRGDELAVFLGMKRRSGWYGWHRYHDAGRQFQPWVGNDWDIGGGGGPYYIGPVLRRSTDDIADLTLDEIEKLARRAFPD